MRVSNYLCYNIVITVVWMFLSHNFKLRGKTAHNTFKMNHLQDILNWEQFNNLCPTRKDDKFKQNELRHENFRQKSQSDRISKQTYSHVRFTKQRRANRKLQLQSRAKMIKKYFETKAKKYQKCCLEAKKSQNSVHMRNCAQIQYA